MRLDLIFHKLRSFGFLTIDNSEIFIDSSTARDRAELLMSFSIHLLLSQWGLKKQYTSIYMPFLAPLNSASSLGIASFTQTST